MDAYEKQEKAREEIRQQNDQLLTEFQKWLVDKNLSNKTINKHTTNIDLYINEFLLYDEVIEAKDGTLEVDMFLGYWFIKKAMWANVSQIKGNITSLKKFYTFMNEKDYVSKRKLDELVELIKLKKDEWIATMERYDDPTIESMEEVWGLDR